jgi:hypothetical protein
MERATKALQLRCGPGGPSPRFQEQQAAPGDLFSWRGLFGSLMTTAAVVNFGFQ